jgi:hypothetical protein
MKTKVYTLSDLTGKRFEQEATSVVEAAKIIHERENPGIKVLTHIRLARRVVLGCWNEGLAPSFVTYDIRK